MNLDLYNHQENKYNFIRKINEFYHQVSKKSEEEILKNSLCGIKNLINIFYINSSLQINNFKFNLNHTAKRFWNVFGRIDLEYKHLIGKFKYTKNYNSF